MEPAEGNIRKRVCKACDRCRLKKSKCDGASPCSRCKADNAICVFGERKKLHDKVYPKGYVEMLEQQQIQLVSGLRELYRRLQAGEPWPGTPLQEPQSGHPLTHDILERLDLLHAPGDAGSPSGTFDEDFSNMQRRLVDNGAEYMHRRDSVSSDSEHGGSPTASSLGTPPEQQMSFPDTYARRSTPLTPPTDSPFPPQSQLAATHMKPSPMLAVPGGAAGLMKPSLDPQQMLRSSWAMQPPTMDDAAMIDQMSLFDGSMSYDTPMSYNPYPLDVATAPSVATATDWMDPSDVDFNNFIDQVQS